MVKSLIVYFAAFILIVLAMLAWSFVLGQREFKKLTLELKRPAVFAEKNPFHRKAQ